VFGGRLRGHPLLPALVFPPRPPRPPPPPPPPPPPHTSTQLPTPVHFSVLCLGVCVTFGVHNYLQEAISRMDGSVFNMHTHAHLFGYIISRYLPLA